MKSILNPLKIIVLILFQITFTPSFGQGKRNEGKPTWLDIAKSAEARWRIGGGMNTGSNTGVHLMLYKLSDVCTSGGQVVIVKKLSFDLSASQEGLVFSKSLSKNDSTWEKGGIRIGLDLKGYIPFYFNPYVGIGYEGGSRYLAGSKNNYSDMVFRLGLEQKIGQIRYSRNTTLIFRAFFEGKYNSCLNADYKYLSSVVGLRLHFI